MYNSQETKNIISALHKQGVTLKEIAGYLNRKGFRTSTQREFAAHDVSQIAVQQLGLRRTKPYVKKVSVADPQASQEVSKSGGRFKMLEDVLTSNLDDETKVKVIKALAEAL